MNYSEQADLLRRHLQIVPFRQNLAAIAPDAVDEALEASILEQAARFTEGVLAPIAADLDRLGAKVVDGRVTTSAQHREAWRAFVEMGWLTMNAPAPYGQGLSLALLTASEELFNRASAAFCMLAPSSRTAASLLAECAPAEVAKLWIPQLLNGEWAATICISEPDAGSDVGRIRTEARKDGEVWRVTGEKCWISYGDHDLAARIGHMALARSRDVAGVRGLSLFLIPSSLDDGSTNGVQVRRIEEKLGLHCSPTCQMGFEGAQAILLGEEGRGLQALFHMMLLMRLSCGPQGTGVASAALAASIGYAQDRRQGGPPDQPAVPIVAHTDVQRQLLSMGATVELTRGLALTAATVLDLAARCEDASEQADWSNLAQFLLPLVKDGSAWAAFDVSSAAVQVLGGAGYTCEWPVERFLRDARVFPVFEGTTGIQALDLLQRRVWRDGRAGLRAFLSNVRLDARNCSALEEAADTLEQTVERLAALADRPVEAEAGADAFLGLCKDVAHGWIAARILSHSGDDPVGRRMAASARFFLAELPARSRCKAELSLAGHERLAGINALIGA